MASRRQAVKCKGHKKNGSPCANYAMIGQLVCHAHGGKAAQNKAKAAERVAEERIRREVAKLDVAPVDDYLGQIALIAGQAIAWKDALAEKVNALTSLRYRADTSGEQLRAEVALWERALDRCERFLTAMARMNIEERMTRVTEKQAAMCDEAFALTLREMGLPIEQQRDARVRLGRHLRSVS